MIDPGREVALVAGDETFTLYAGNRALRLIERETGKPMPDVLEEMQRGSVGLMTTLLWALLQQHHPGTSIDETDDIIDTAGYEAIRDALDVAATRAFQMSDGAGDDMGKAVALNGAAPGTGRKSSPVRSRPG